MAPFCRIFVKEARRCFILGPSSSPSFILFLFLFLSKNYSRTFKIPCHFTRARNLSRKVSKYIRINRVCNVQIALTVSFKRSRVTSVGSTFFFPFDYCMSACICQSQPFPDQIGVGGEGTVVMPPAAQPMPPTTTTTVLIQTNETPSRESLITTHSSGFSSRKGRPQRAPSWTDRLPGVIFKLHPEADLQQRLNSWIPRSEGGGGCELLVGSDDQEEQPEQRPQRKQRSFSDINIGRTPAALNASFPSWIFEDSVVNQSRILQSFYSGGAKARSMSQVIDRGSLETFESGVRSSCSLFEGQTTGSTSSWSQRRRKHSVDESVITGSLRSSASYDPLLEDDCGFFTPPLQRQLQQHSKTRKSSLPGECLAGQQLSATSSPPPAQHHNPSLSHLIPNRLLSTTSRRISTHSQAPGCACSSCGCTVTPYWRDGWAADVMLCNACGLRFQKFARRCPSCLYIPRKEDSLGDCCVKCDTPWAR